MVFKTVRNARYGYSETYQDARETSQQCSPASSAAPTVDHNLYNEAISGLFACIPRSIYSSTLLATPPGWNKSVLKGVSVVIP